MDGKDDEAGDQDVTDDKDTADSDNCLKDSTDGMCSYTSQLGTGATSQSKTFLTHTSLCMENGNASSGNDSVLDDSGTDDNTPGGDSILGMVDKLMSEIAPDGNIIDLSSMVANSDDRGCEDNSDKVHCDADPIQIKQEEISLMSDRIGKPEHNQSSPPVGQGPPSGPFVVGDQVGIVMDNYGGGNFGALDSAFMNSSGHHASNVTFEQSNFLDQLDKYKWQSSLGATSRAALPRQQKVRTDLTLADKVRLIEISEATGKSQRSLAAEFHISVGSVNNILRRKREYREALENHETSVSKNSKIPRQQGPRSPKAPVYNELQILVMRWLEVAKVKVKPLTWPVVLEKAKEFASKMNMTTFSTSTAWLEELRHSMDIPLQAMPVSIRTERDASILGSWRKMLPFLVQGYQPENVFCVTETTLYYRCLPDCCYIGGPLCQNSHNFMEVLEHRFTVLLCCNMLGERMKPLVVSRHACPPSLRGVSLGDLPVVWCHQPNAVITTEIFAGWLLTVEASMAQQRRHIALFMEMVPSHLSSTLLKHVSLKFFLDGSSHLLQPLNQGIVRDFKANFRRRLLQTALAQGRSSGDAGEQASKCVTELDVVFWIQEAWRNISSVTIHSCFQNTGFLQSLQASTSQSGLRGIDPLPNDYVRLVHEAGRMFRFTPMSPEVYAEFDSQLQCHSGDMEEWEASLLAEATGGRVRPIKKEPGSDSGSMDIFVGQSHSSSGSGGSMERVRPSEALECLSKLKRFSCSNIGLLTTVFEMESLILDSLGKSLARS